MNGILNLDKPAGISSARAVGQVKRLLPKGTKIGHAGTLDPFATGVLLLLIGRGTKCCEALMDRPKQYHATVQFGSTTATDDPESPQISWPHLSAQSPPDLTTVRGNIAQFTGTVLQAPPSFSAMKINGQRAYKLARAGAAPVMLPRPVMIYSIQVMDYQWPNLQLCIDCGRGTYIRSLARDLGASLNVGGHLTQLRRTSVGQFSIENSVTLNQLSSQSLLQYLQPIEVIA